MKSNILYSSDFAISHLHANETIPYVCLFLCLESLDGIQKIILKKITFPFDCQKPQTFKKRYKAYILRRQISNLGHINFEQSHFQICTNCRHHNTRFQGKLQGIYNTTMLVVDQEQKCRPIKETRHPRNQSMHIYNQQIFDKLAKNYLLQRDSVFNKRCWKNWAYAQRKTEQDPYTIYYQNINSK